MLNILFGRKGIETLSVASSALVLNEQELASVIGGHGNNNGNNCCCDCCCCNCCCCDWCECECEERCCFDRFFWGGGFFF